MFITNNKTLNKLYVMPCWKEIINKNKINGINVTNCAVKLPYYSLKFSLDGYVNK